MGHFACVQLHAAVILTHTHTHLYTTRIVYRYARACLIRNKPDIIAVYSVVAEREIARTGCRPHRDPSDRRRDGFCSVFRRFSRRLLGLDFNIQRNVSNGRNKWNTTSWTDEFREFSNRQQRILWSSGKSHGPPTIDALRKCSPSVTLKTMVYDR